MTRVVCEGCPFESEEDIEQIARYLRDMHQLMKGHNVRVEQ